MENMEELNMASAKLGISIEEVTNAFKEIEKLILDLNERSYQMKHRKVKDRYASPKFYMNNFKRKGKDDERWLYA